METQMTPDQNKAALEALDRLLAHIDALEYMDEDIVRDIKTIRTALSGGGWQKIESVPADTVVLLYSPDRGIDNEERIECREFRNTRAGSQHAWATHWMPLPPQPPKDAP